MRIATDFASGAAVAPGTGAIDLTSDSGLTVDVVSSAAGLDAMAADWAALQDLSEPTAVFQSFAHVRLWARHFATSDRNTALHVAVVRDRGRPILILPLALSGPSFLRVARIAGDPVAQYAGVLIDPAKVSRAAFEAALVSIRDAGADAIVLRGLRDDSRLLQFAAPFLRPAIAHTKAPSAELSGFSDYPAFLKSLSKRMRQSLRNRRHHLERVGNFSFEILHGGATARAAVAEALDLKRKWLVQRGNLSSAFLDPATKACLLDLAESAESGAAVARLIVGGETAAIRFGFEYRGTHFAYMSAYDERFAEVSPGKLLMEYCVSGFWERGVERLDLLPPDGRHKRDWCRLETGVADYTLPLTATGRAYAQIYQERVRPALKRAFGLMPETLRSLATALFIRI